MKESTVWSGFYKKPLKERQQQLKLVFPDLFASANGGGPLESPSAHHQQGMDGGFPIHGLDEFTADNMVENCIGTLGMPVGLGLNFVINGKSYAVPMAVEEPSVVAAASNAAKTISTLSEGGGFIATHSEQNIMIAQVQVMDLPNPAEAIKLLQGHREELMSLGNDFCPTMKKRGGGVVDVHFRLITPREDLHTRRRRNSLGEMNGVTSRPAYLVVHIHVNVCEAMGANIVNTVAEGVAPRIAELTGGRVGLKILSNLSTQRVARSSFRIPVERLKYKDFEGSEVAMRMLEAYEFSEDDPFRAATSNKGIMNGIDAVALATGQDWRAIEAAAHAYAPLQTQRYGSLSKYWIEEEKTGEQFFCAMLELPMPVGTKGGVLMTNPVYHYTHGLLGFPDAKTLAMIIVSVGLAQNFAAIRALATEGIQKGHMSLHARNIAISAGTPPHAISEVTAYLVASKRINVEAAQAYLKAHELHAKITQRSERKKVKEPSTFYYEEGMTLPGRKPLMLNIVFQTLGETPLNLELTERRPTTDLQRRLLGDKGNSWLTSIFAALEAARVSSLTGSRSNVELQRILKVLSVLMNVVTRSLLLHHRAETVQFITKLLSLTFFKKRSGSTSLRTWSPDLQFKGDQESLLPESQLVHLDVLEFVTTDSEVLLVGFPLLLAFWQVFEIEIAQYLGHQQLAVAILEEQCQIMHSLIYSYPKPGSDLPFEDFMIVQLKKFQITLFLLCDAIGLESKVVNTEFLQTLLLLGSYLEWEGIAAHDVYHRERDASLGTPNAFVYWRHSPKAAQYVKENLSDKELGKLFLQQASKKQEMLRVFEDDLKDSSSSSSSSSSFDLSLCLASSKAIITYYSLEDFVV